MNTRRSLPILLAVIGIMWAPALAQASSVSIGSLSPSTTVSVGTNVSFSVATSGFSNPSFSVSDSFSGSSASNSDINSSGDFSWTPTSNDIGTHTFTISVSDGNNDSGTATETITVQSGPSISITGINPGYSVVYGTPLTFNVSASGFSSPVYTVSDSFNNGGGSLSSADVSSSGAFSWTPVSSDQGQHVITITVVDSQGHSASQQLTVTVEGPQLTVEGVSPSLTIGVGQTLTYQVIPTGITNPSYSFGDSLAGSSVSSTQVVNTTNYFGQTIQEAQWTPTVGDVGPHTITISAEGNGVSAVDTLTIQVNPAGYSETFVPTSTASPAVTTPAVPVTATPTTTQVSLAVPQTPATTASFSGVLASGSTGTQVTALQNLLRSLGFLSANATGYFGPATQAALKKFQTAHGVAATGTTGPETRAWLNEASGTTAATTISATPESTTAESTAYLFSTELENGSRGAAVTALQERLTAEGDYSGPVTGYFGAETQAAVEKYQKGQGFSTVGILGPQTRAALNAGK